MHIDITRTPFSRRGSFFALSRLVGRSDVPAGLYLRTIRGGAKTKEVFALIPSGAWGISDFVDVVSPGSLTLEGGEGRVEVAIDELDRVLVRTENASVELEALLVSDYDLITPVSPGRWQYICYGSDINLMLTVHEGTLEVDAHWTGVKNDRLRMRLTPSSESGTSLLSVEEFATAYRQTEAPPLFGETVVSAEADFARWLHRAPAVPVDLTETRELASYVNWASTVSPRGHIVRPVMYMSKNWMTNVWAWDHCFNAMALIGDVRAAVDQFLCIFDFQDDEGGIPDCFNDSFVSRNFTKPAVHGWALQWMLQRTEFDDEFLAEAYRVLSKWTEWWFTHRVYRVDGVPAYNHGNDSGWDNSTAFASFVPVESPDQVAFLVIQLETLSQLASAQGDDAAAAAWMTRSRDLLDVLIREFWRDGRFIARHAITHEVVRCDSLLMFVPLVLGERLPTAVFDSLVGQLTSRGFLTEFGLATECTSSPLYVSDGYWRGPIWAPPTLLIVDGLRRGGEKQLAASIAQRFCGLAQRSGMAENFDAVSGDGLRDRAYTWTASVFLILASEYVSELS